MNKSTKTKVFWKFWKLYFRSQGKNSI